jgi:DNA-binding transcriptional LysR family regulator
MHERYRNTNIPIELLRTLVAIAETKSFTKTAAKLELSQPAISAQVRRLQAIVGGSLFEKTSGGIALNERGKLVISHAQRLLEANDRILSLAGPAHSRRLVRVGISTLYADDFLKKIALDESSDVQIYCDHSEEISKGVLDGYIDIGCSLFYFTPPAMNRIAEWEESLVWVRGRDFLLSPGAVIPLVGWPNMALDRLALETLEKRGFRYELVFSSPDHASRVAAVAAGLGVMPSAERTLVPPLVVAREYYLPPLPSLSAGIFVRDGIERDDFKPLVRKLMALAPDGHQSTPRANERRPEQIEAEAPLVPLAPEPSVGTSPESRGTTQPRGVRG